MVDFSKLLKVKADDIKRPKELAPGDYPGKIKKYEFGDNNKNKTPYVRYHLALLGWPDSIDAEDRVDGTEPIDLSKRQLRRDFFITPESIFILKEFMEEMGLDTAGKEMDELVPQLVGEDVLVEVQQFINQQTGVIGNQVGKLLKLA